MAQPALPAPTITKVAAMVAAKIHRQITKNLAEPKHDKGEWSVFSNY